MNCLARTRKRAARGARQIAPRVQGQNGGRRAPRQRGVSLAELLVVLAIGAGVLGIGLPDLATLLRSQQLQMASDELHGALRLARAEAIARGERILVRPRDTAGVDWAQGWTVFADRDGDAVPGAGDAILAVHGALAPGLMTAFAFTSSAAPYYIAYNGAGRSCSASSSASARWGTLSLFHGGAVRRIKINMLGRTRACNPAHDASCDGAATPPETK